MIKNDVSNEEKSHGGFATGLFLGALLGTGALFFYGTKKGGRLRKLLKQEFSQWSKGADEVRGKLPRVVAEVAAKVKGMVGEARLETTLGKKEVSTQAERMVTEVVDKADEVKEAMRKAVKKTSVFKRFFTRKGRPLKA
ncbi:hypothetical protein A3A66_02990 [Microgenomates group bacterium RIFCSPLOWO2_01_FULL_46_13]|nr:MAG: hypothetical protein A2783_05245 [Microgenomates group bacterium RIFCSPHIGHO2_01_FULL_45_11]OGV95137.1 MAG: hypothetical protein A3A66_02990 [Microgenomates group bacterium RIFCSPLOWO2_01_FULL_46_13]